MFTHTLGVTTFTTSKKERRKKRGVDDSGNDDVEKCIARIMRRINNSNGCDSFSADNATHYRNRAA